MVTTQRKAQGKVTTGERVSKHTLRKKKLSRWNGTGNVFMTDSIRLKIEKGRVHNITYSKALE